MNLKPEFVSTLLKNIKEVEKKNVLSAKLNTSTAKKIPTPKGSSTKGQSFNLSDNLNKDRSFFDLIASSIGYHETLNWITKKVNLLDVPAETFQKAVKDSEIAEFDEYRMHYIFKEIFTEVQENQIQDFFDLFETKLSSKITSVELYLIIAYVASTETLQTLDFLHVYGETIFQALCAGQGSISDSRMKTFGKLIGITERKLLTTIRELGIKDENSLTLEEFEMVYFAIFEDMESSLAKSSLTGALSQKKENSKIRTCRSGCNLM